MFKQFKPRWWYFPLFIFIPIIIVIWYWCPIFTSSTTVFVVRHAEKASGQNPSLTQPGINRAQTLGSLLRSANLAAVYSTEFCRTAQTAQPSAQSNSVGIKVYTVSSSVANFQSCVPSIVVQTSVTNAQTDHVSKITADIFSNHQGKNVLVVGHSNTVPEIVEALGAPSLCPTFFPLDESNECHIPSGENSQFDNLFVVTVLGNGNARVARLRYGNPTN